MGKHKHRNQQVNQQTKPVEKSEEDILAASLSGDVTADAEPAAEQEPEVEAVAEQPASIATTTTETKPVAAPAPQEEVKKPEVVDLDKGAKTSAPSITFGRASKRTASDQTPNTKEVKSILSSVPEDLRMHTAQGRQLIKMFDEYAALCREARPDDGNAHAICARKLYDIMVICCPRGGYNGNANYMNELIGIVFKRLVQGYGTLFKESTLLRADYRLPTPTDSMKFDAFYSSMYQLVECAKTGARIRFNNIALSKVLQSPAAMTVITNIRRRLEAAHR